MSKEGELTTIEVRQARELADQILNHGYDGEFHNKDVKALAEIYVAESEDLVQRLKDVKFEAKKESIFINGFPAMRDLISGRAGEKRDIKADEKALESILEGKTPAEQDEFVQALLTEYKQGELTESPRNPQAIVSSISPEEAQIK